MCTFYFMIASTVAYILSQFMPVLELCAISRVQLGCSSQYQRLIAAMFLHGSLFHFLCNTAAHFLLVLPLEAAWGRTRFVSIYVLSAVIGGLFAGITTEISVTSSAGLFGVVGSFLALIVVYKDRIGVLVARSLLLYLCTVPLLFLALSFLPNVVYLSNIGGLIGGAAAGAVIFAPRTDNPRLKAGLAAVGGIVIGVCIGGPVAAIYATQSQACGA
jgi:membrane associated rhomboid family serine protease